MHLFGDEGHSAGSIIYVVACSCSYDLRKMLGVRYWAPKMQLSCVFEILSPKRCGDSAEMLEDRLEQPKGEKRPRQGLVLKQPLTQIGQTGWVRKIPKFKLQIKWIDCKLLKLGIATCLLTYLPATLMYDQWKFSAYYSARNSNSC